MITVEKMQYLFDCMVQVCRAISTSQVDVSNTALIVSGSPHAIKNVAEAVMKEIEERSEPS